MPPSSDKQLNARFPDRKATVKAWCDASFNVGLTVCLVFQIILSILKKDISNLTFKVGPVLGALLYEAAGFCLPFALTGTAILLSGGLVLLVTKMPAMASTTSSPQSSSLLLAILSKPTVLIGLATATAGAYSIGTVEVGKHV